MNISSWKLLGWFRRPQLWTTGDWQLHHNDAPFTHHVSCRVFWQNSKSPGDSAPLQPRFGALWLLAFPKTKITFESEEISDCWWDSGITTGKLMAIGRTMWGPKVPTLKGTEVSLSYVQCFLYLIFFKKCLYFSYYMAGYLLDRCGILTKEH